MKEEPRSRSRSTSPVAAGASSAGPGTGGSSSASGPRVLAAHDSGDSVEQLDDEALVNALQDLLAPGGDSEPAAVMESLPPPPEVSLPQPPEVMEPAASAADPQPRIDSADVVTIWADEGSMLLLELFQNALSRCQDVGQVLSYFVDHQGWLWVRFATERQAARLVGRLNGRAIEGGLFNMHVVQTRASLWPPGMVPPRLVGRGAKEPMPPQVAERYHAAKAIGKHIPGGGWRRSDVRRSDERLATPADSAAVRPPPPPPPPAALKAKRPVPPWRRDRQQLSAKFSAW